MAAEAAVKSPWHPTPKETRLRRQFRSSLSAAAQGSRTLWHPRALPPEVTVHVDSSSEFQNIAKLCLEMLFTGSTEGAHRACMLLGSSATCRDLAVTVRATLTGAFGLLGAQRDVFDMRLEALTPEAFTLNPV
jgi:hypothetical protein